MTFEKFIPQIISIEVYPLSPEIFVEVYPYTNILDLKLKKKIIGYMYIRVG